VKACPKVGPEATRRAEIARAITQILEAEGFHVECNAETMAGYDVDCLFRRNYKLFELRGGVIIICGRAGAGEIGYAAALRNSLGLDKIIVVARDGVEEEAKALAAGYGVAIAGFDDVSEKARLLEVARVYYIDFGVDQGKISRIGKSLEGFIIRRGRFVKALRAYLPIGAFQVTLSRIPGDSSGAFSSENVEVDVDLTSGSLVGVSADGSLYTNPMIRTRLTALSRMHIAILSIILEEGGSTIEELAERLGASLSDVEHEVGVLASMGLVELVRGELIIPKNIRLGELKGILEVKRDLLKPGKPSGGIILPERVEVDVIEELLEAYGKIHGETRVYYPLYILIFQKRKNGRVHYNYIVADGLTGKRLEDLEEALASSGIAEELESLI
jgi:DNA-binding transcriptional ArsR family regulator